MSESDRSRSTSPASDQRSNDKDSARKHQRSRASDSDRSSYSEKFYSDDENQRKGQAKKKQLNGGVRSNKGLFQRSRPGMVGSNHRIGGSGGGSEGTVAARHVISANRLKVNDLRNKVSELAGQLFELQQEKKDIRRQLRLRERRLEQYEHQENDMPTLLQRQAQETHVFREQLRRQKKRLEEKEKKLKNTQEELQRNQRLLKKMKELVDDKQLAERDDLNNKLLKVESDLKEKGSALKKLEDYAENLKKNHKHELGIERARHKDTQRQVTELQTELERMRTLLKDKEKEHGINNIRASRQPKPPHHLNGCTSTSPISDVQSHQGGQAKHRNSGPNRKASAGSLDSVMESRKQQPKKVISKEETFKEENKESDSEIRQRVVREREIEKRLELERHRGHTKETEREKESEKLTERQQDSVIKQHKLAAEPKQRQDEAKDLSFSKSELENKLHKKDLKGSKSESDGRSIERHERKTREDEEVKFRLEKDLQHRERKEKEERERHSKELEAGRQAQSLEEEERLKQKASLLAKMRAIDEQKLMNDKEFFLTTPSQNEFLPREKQMVANEDKTFPSFGEYRPSFLGGSASGKSNRTASNMNSKVGNEARSKANLIDELNIYEGSSLLPSKKSQDKKRIGVDLNKGERHVRSTIDASKGDLDEDIEEVVL